VPEISLNTEPTVEAFEAMAKNRGVVLEPARLAEAVEMHAKFRHELDRLRAVRLDFLPPYIEPATALRWIESEGGLHDRAGRPDGK